MKVLALYVSIRNCFNSSLFSSVAVQGRDGGSGGSSLTGHPQLAVLPLLCFSPRQGSSVAVSALCPWTPATQPKLVLPCTLGKSLGMMLRPFSASTLRKVADSSSTTYSISLVVELLPS